MQITEHVHALRLNYEIRVSPTMIVKRFVYVYLIVGQKVHLIDAGIASSVEQIQSYLLSIGRSLNEVTTVSLTHSHPDHMGGLKPIHEQSGCRVVVHESERSWVEDVQQQAQDRPMPGLDRLVAGNVKVDQALKGGETIELEPGLTLDVIHTPGHSKGSVSYLLNEERVLFTGDAVAFAWGVPVYDDVLASLAAVKRLQSIEDVACLLSSWDKPRQGDEVAGVFDRCLTYLQKIHDAVRAEVNDSSPVDPMQLCQAVLSRLKLPSVAANPLVAESLMSHLNCLNRAILID